MRVWETVAGSLGAVLLVTAGAIGSGSDVDGNRIVGASVMAVIAGLLLHLVLRRLQQKKNLAL